MPQSRKRFQRSDSNPSTIEPLPTSTAAQDCSDRETVDGCLDRVRYLYITFRNFCSITAGL